MVASTETIAVVYLARKNDGPIAFRNFLRSYRTHPAGMQHVLVVAFKGYTGTADLRKAQEEFASVSYTALELPDEGFGLGSCLEVAKRLPHTYICWFNTWSRIIGDHWLEKFYMHLSSPEVGMVSATGSYEGVFDSLALMRKVLWLNKRSELNPIQQASLDKYFGFLLHRSNLRFRPTWTDGLKLLKVLGKNFLKSMYYTAIRLGSKRLDWRELHEQLERQAEEKKIRPYRVFPRFPNPHLRPNGFMIRRKHLADEKRKPFLTKAEELDLECGEQGLTRKLLQAGLKVKIVGLNGMAYDIDQWPYSNTFRCGRQNNLLIADNQTEFFESLSEDDRITYEWLTWGEKTLALPKDFPDFLKMK